eukprot:gene13619-biopygen21580
MGPEVGPAFQRRSRESEFSNLGVRLAETVSTHFVTGGSKISGNSCLRAAIRTAARARSGRTNDTDGLWEIEFCGHTPWFGVTESRSATCDVGGTPGGEGVVRLMVRKMDRTAAPQTPQEENMCGTRCAIIVFRGLTPAKYPFQTRGREPQRRCREPQRRGSGTPNASDGNPTGE